MKPLHWKVVLVVLAFVVRLALLELGVGSVLANRVEVITPVTGLKRLIEGLFLFQIGLSPYAGNVFHQAPLLLPLLAPFLSPSSPKIYLHILFVAADVLTGLVLFWIAESYIGDDDPIKIAPEKTTSATTVSSSSRNKTFHPPQVSWFSLNPHALAALYLFNPYSIATCVGLSTLVFTTLAIALCAYYSLKGNPPLATFFLALACYLSFSPLVLLVPVCVLLKKHTKKKLPAIHLVTVSLFTLFLGGLLYLSFVLMGSWEFLRKTYGFYLFVEDLTPNIGLFWYYFVEIFMQFKNFFLFVFQFHPFVYIVPLTYRLSNHPLFLFWTLLAISSTFKAYPALGDFALPLSMLPLFHKILFRLTYPVIVGVVMVVVVVLAPVLWQMWIYTGGGNANFYYAITLVFTLAQVLLISDAASSVVKLDYLKKHNIIRSADENKND